MHIQRSAHSETHMQTPSMHATKPYAFCGRASEVRGVQPHKARDGERGEGRAATQGEGWQAR
eukprot:scaffold104899_cov75-Phaeocystis_antarctica.AAC.1